MDQKYFDKPILNMTRDFSKLTGERTSSGDSNSSGLFKVDRQRRDIRHLYERKTQESERNSSNSSM